MESTVINTSEDSQESQFYVEGIKCSRCIYKIESSLSQLPGLSFVQVNLGQKLLTLHGSSSALKNVPQNLLELGFLARPLQDSSDLLKKNREKNRWHLLRLGVAGFAMANIMLLSVSIYAGADQSELKGFFEWLSFFLFLPSLLFSAYPFYQDLWRSLKAKRPNIDLPIVAAIWFGFGMSVYSLLTSAPYIYFDSLSTLIFLLLASRYLLMRIQDRYLSPSLLKAFTPSGVVLKIEGSTRSLVPIEKIHIGDLLVLGENETLVFDGELFSTSSYLDTSILTGESLPQKILKGENLYAGTKNLSAESILKVTKLSHETRLSRILSSMEQEILTKTPTIEFADRMGRWFTRIVMSLSILVFFYFLGSDPGEGLRRGLALVILACPCVFAFATPLTQSLALMLAAQKGLFIKSALVLEKLTQIKQIYFDKTGTLTKAQLQVLKWFPKAPSTEQLRLLKSLEQGAHHPVAKAILRSTEEQDLLSLEQWQEIPGRGVEAYWQGRLYEVKSLDQAIESKVIGTQVGLYEDGKLILGIVLGDEIKTDAFDLVLELKNRDYRLSLISGDQEESVKNLAEKLEIPFENCHFRMSPEDKQNVLKNSSKAMMIGDGVNDSIAMAASSVSLAVQGSMEASLKVSDIYLANPNLNLISASLKLSKESFKVIRRNLFLSLTYNLIGGGAALLGHIHPLLAAILMPLSSLTVLSSALIGTQWIRQFRKIAPHETNDLNSQSSFAIEESSTKSTHDKIPRLQVGESK